MKQPPVNFEVFKAVDQQRKDLQKIIKGSAQLTVRDILKKMGVQPAVELIKLAQGIEGEPKLTIDQQIRIWTELLQYQQPKLKAVEHSGKVEQEITIMVRKFDGPVTPRKIANSKPVIEIGS